jgi:hypothetical protein
LFNVCILPKGNFLEIRIKSKNMDVSSSHQQDHGKIVIKDEDGYSEEEFVDDAQVYFILNEMFTV